MKSQYMGLDSSKCTQCKGTGIIIGNGKTDDKWCPYCNAAIKIEVNRQKQTMPFVEQAGPSAPNWYALPCALVSVDALFKMKWDEK